MVYATKFLDYLIEISTKEEYDKLDFHFENQKPTDKLHPEFYTTAVRGKFDDMSAYWWDCESRNRENNSATYGRKISSPKLIRTKFIKHMIEFTKDI